MESAKTYFEALAKNYRFDWMNLQDFNNKCKQFGTAESVYLLGRTIKNVSDILQKGQQGYIMYNPYTHTISLIGIEKTILKRMQNDIIKNYHSFSDSKSPKTGLGHEKTDWTGKQTTSNVGSKGTYAVDKRAGKNSLSQGGLQTYTKPDGEISVATILVG